MAQWDDAENYDTPYPNDGGPVQDPHGPGSPLWQAIAGIYQTALGRAASPAEIQSQIQGGSGDLATIQQSIYSSPEAAAYNQSRQPAAPQAADPTTTNQVATTGPGPVAAPGVGTGPAPAAGTQAAPGNIPSYTSPAPLSAPAPFAYDPYVATSQQDVLDDPDYQLMRDQGIQAIGHKNAALGTLNTGGTIGDFIGFASNLAHAKYGDIDARRFGQYQAGRADAFDTYKTNYGIGKDVYDTNYKDQYADPFANDLAGAQLGQQNNQFNAQLGQNNNQFNTTTDFNKWLQNYKMSVTDPFDMKYKTLSLL